MKESFRTSFMAVLITLTLLISAIGVTPAFADDGAPPPTETEEVTEPITSESDPSSAEEPVTAPEEAVVSVGETLEQLPAETTVVVLDESGEIMPLATEATAAVVAEADPKWCPEGKQANDPSCSSNFASIELLLADMQTNSGDFYSRDGVIYFERAALTTYTSSFILDDSSASLGASYETLKGYNITLQGGWAGGTSASVPGHSLFGSGAYIQVGTASNPWLRNVTINDMQVGQNVANGGVSASNSVTVYSNGDITLDNVDVYQQEGNYNTAYLESNDGNITVGNTSVFDGNNAATKQNRGFYAGASGTITISNSTFQQASQPGTPYSHGATLDAPVINLDTVKANGNDGSGIYVPGTSSTVVNLTGGTYNNNKRYGIELAGGGTLNEFTAPTCTGNALGCYNGAANTPPTITVNDVTVEANTLGGWTLAFNAIGSASDAQDGTPLVNCTPAPGSMLSLGTTAVSCTATDSQGLTATDSGSVNVVDTTAPILSTLADITVEATSPAGAVATFAPTATDTVSGALSVTCTSASGSTFPLGTTSVTCSATDGSGNVTTGSFNVNIVDTSAPVLSTPADITVEATSSAGAIVTFAASATDTASGTLSVTCTSASGSTFPLGTTSVTCSTTDGSGNVTTGSFNVTVVDTTAPLLSLPLGINATAKTKAGAIISFSASATDAVDGAPTVTCSPASGYRFPVGVTSVVCSVADSAGNSATGSFLVTVEYESSSTVPYIVTQQTEAQLPGALGQAETFVTALKLEFVDLAAKMGNLKVTLSFPIAASMQNAKLAVMYWDGSKWIEMHGGGVIGSYFVITVDKPGFYVLVSQ